MLTAAEKDADKDVEKAQELVFDISRYYKQDNKTLDISNVPLDNEQFKNVWPDIKKFITTAGVEQLIMENMELTKIPYYVITFALGDKTLSYVSMVNNKFKITTTTTSSSSVSSVDKKMKELSIDTRSRSESITNVITSLWDLINPKIQKVIDTKNKDNEQQRFYKKIIRIDSRIPPITIINQDNLPPSTKEKTKEVCKKILLVAIGTIGSLIPWLATYLGELDPSYCDMGAFGQMATNCNVTLNL